MEPFSVVKQEVDAVSERLRHSVSTGIPALKTAAEYFFRRGIEGKRLRPTLALLMASALSPSAPPQEYLQVDVRPAAEHAPELRRRQQRIAEIAELIHVASLLHDDVIDDEESDEAEEGDFIEYPPGNIFPTLFHYFFRAFL